jgi:glycosyltransferase 2 family protein
MKSMKRWQFWVGVLISLFFMYIALRGLHLEDLGDAVQNANYWWLLPGVLVYFVGVWARAWRWHYLLRPVKKISTRTMFPVVAIGYMGNNIYPARAGEVLRAVVLKRREGVPVSASLATIIVERIFDGVVMLGFIFINLPELARLTHDSGFIGSIQTAALVGTAAFAGAPYAFSRESAQSGWPLPGRAGSFTLSPRCPDGFYNLCGHLAARNGKILVGNARVPL